MCGYVACMKWCVARAYEYAAFVYLRLACAVCVSACGAGILGVCMCLWRRCMNIQRACTSMCVLGSLCIWACGMRVCAYCVHIWACSLRKKYLPSPETSRNELLGSNVSIKVHLRKRFDISWVA